MHPAINLQTRMIHGSQ